MAGLVGAEAVEDAVAAQENEVMLVFLYVDIVDLWVNYDNVRVAIVFFELGLTISESARY